MKTGPTQPIALNKNSFVENDYIFCAQFTLRNLQYLDKTDILCHKYISNNKTQEQI